MSMKHRDPRVAFALAIASCGTLGDEPGGNDELPNRGINPYLLAEDVLVIEDSATTRYSRPSSIVLDDGLALYVDATVGSTSTLALFTTRDGFAFAERPLPRVLGRSPGVSPRGGGAVVAFDRGEPRSLWIVTLDGLLPSGDPELLLEPAGELDAGGASDPSLVEVDGELWIYYSALSVDGERAIARARADGNGTVMAREVVLRGHTGCTSPSGKADRCWDEDGLTSPEVRLSRSATGRRIFRMTFTGWNGSSAAIGFAASFDGAGFEPLADNPILSDRDRSLSDPTNAQRDDEYLLHFSTEGGVGGARNEAGAPSERFEAAALSGRLGG
ncbi:MAG: hypothetical protein HYV07_33705 [Deltaproteobacteria bacterium]|nr:hypothetical protein [Deltaproteobacteria bacterium]